MSQLPSYCFNRWCSGPGADRSSAAGASPLNTRSAADTTALDIGSSVATDLHEMRSTLEDGRPAGRRTVAELSAPGVTPANGLARVRSLAVAPTDALVVYYAGHGAWADTGPYLR